MSFEAFRTYCLLSFKMIRWIYIYPLWLSTWF